MQYALALNLTSHHPSVLLSPATLKAMHARFEANAIQWLANNAPTTSTKPPREQRSASGRKPKVIANPFHALVGKNTYWGLYPVFAMDIIEGIARLDCHDRAIGQGGKSTPLSVRNLAIILESLPFITNEAVEDLLQLRERHARRYVKAVELIIPRMMKSRPKSLYNEMERIEPEPKDCEWDDTDSLLIPSFEELEKLHYDMRTLTQFKSAEEYDNLHAAELVGPNTSNVIAFPARKQHPKKAEVLDLLSQKMNLSAIEQLTGVPRKTTRQWRDETLSEMLAA